MSPSERPILIAGTGSIGRRHLKNLQTLDYKNFVLFRTGKSTLPGDEIKNIPQEYDLLNALAHKPFATIIANPTALHMHVALEAARAGSHIFIEKPISNSMDGVETLRQLVRKNNLIVQTGFHFRFNPGLRKVKQLLEKDAIGPVVSVQAHWGDWLPGWHPWEDYRCDGFSARLNQSLPWKVETVRSV
jgi:predicted dehydrogenase